MCVISFFKACLFTYLVSDIDLFWDKFSYKAFIWLSFFLRATYQTRLFVRQRVVRFIYFPLKRLTHCSYSLLNRRPTSPAYRYSMGCVRVTSSYVTQCLTLKCYFFSQPYKSGLFTNIVRHISLWFIIWSHDPSLLMFSSFSPFRPASVFAWAPLYLIC